MTLTERKTINEWRVLDLGIITAGAATSGVLSDFGANVIKIESQSYQDPFRKWAGKWDLGTDLSPVFQFTNRNKRGLELDLKSPAGRAQFLDLVAQSDIVVENFRRGVLQRLGLDFPTLAKANPSIVLASLSSQGDSGPDSDYASFGSTLDAIGGFAAITGYPGDEPVVTGRNVNYPDQLAALMAAGAIIAATRHAKNTGEGAHVDISQREIVAFSISEYVAASTDHPVPTERLRRGNADPAGRLQGCFCAHDGRWMAVTVPAERLAAICTHLDTRPDDALGTEAALQAWIAAQPGETVLATLAALGVSIAPVLSGAEILKSDIGSVGRIFVRDPHGDLVKGSPFGQEKPFQAHRVAPALGEHTRDILAEVLGIDADPT